VVADIQNPYFTRICRARGGHRSALWLCCLPLQYR
jgi:hypothetical protein